MFQYSPEIHDYFTRFADKYNLRRYVKLHHKVVSAVWDEDKGQYKVEIETPDGLTEDYCDILMNGSGLINKWKCWSQ
jgi:cation diffusion facilitator CzcD-associated flavoprotein CzcO